MNQITQKAHLAIRITVLHPRIAMGIFLTCFQPPFSLMGERGEKMGTWIKKALNGDPKRRRISRTMPTYLIFSYSSLLCNQHLTMA
jgi:hypothetical protein